MKDENLKDERLESLASAIVPEAVEWVEQLKEYRKYSGRDIEYFRRARVGVSIISAAVRLCATVENSRTNNMLLHRLQSHDALKLTD